MSACRSPWFAGFTSDHLYADCPNRTRAETNLRRYGWWDIGSHGSAIDPTIDPHAGDVCGMCLHRHNRREHKAHRVDRNPAETSQTNASQEETK